MDNRWWDRLGAAFMLSFVKDAIALETAYMIANKRLAHLTDDNLLDKCNKNDLMEMAFKAIHRLVKISFYDKLVEI